MNAERRARKVLLLVQARYLYPTIGRKRQGKKVGITLAETNELWEDTTTEMIRTKRGEFSKDSGWKKVSFPMVQDL